MSDREVVSLVEACKDSAVRGMNVFLCVLSHVPEDKLNWSPSPTAKTPIQIAAHTAVTNGNFARMMRARRIPTGEEIPVIVAETAAAEAALTDLTEIESLLRKNTDEVIAALDSLTPEDIALSMDSSLGWSMPMTFLMQLPGIHTCAHASQLDYLQTCWDDQVVHF